MVIGKVELLESIADQGALYVDTFLIETKRDRGAFVSISFSSAGRTSASPINRRMKGEIS